uniref:Tgr11392C n=1 Tax=Dictyostelium purpureum TaxID=5786 RepID=A0A3Q9DS96_DICPU|nr:tgr11392C [Dictyostelium purpureum]
MIIKNKKKVLFLLLIQIVFSFGALIHTIGGLMDLDMERKYEAIPINITLYKDPNFKIPGSVIYFKHYDYYNETAHFHFTKLLGEIKSEDSKKYYGSVYNACVIRFENNKTECGYYDDNINLVLPTPVKVKFLSSPPTRGGIVNVTGEYMRIGCGDLKVVSMIFPIYRRMVTAGEYNDPNYDPNNLAITFPSLYGTATVCFDSVLDFCYEVPYQSPSVSSYSYNASSQKITIRGQNFYNSTYYKYDRVVYVNINNSSLDLSDIISVDYEEMVLNYSSIFTQELNVSIFISDLSTNNTIQIPPHPASYSTNATKYNEGIVEISGTQLLSPTDQNDLKISIFGKQCIFIPPSNISYIKCTLPKGDDNKQNTIQVCVNNICSINNLTYEYAKPVISGATQNGSVFTILGNYHGSYNENTTQVIVTYDNNIKQILLPLSIQPDETASVFKIPFFCGSAIVQLVVNGFKSNEYTINANTNAEIISPPSTDSKSPLIVLLSYYDCKYYKSNNLNPLLKIQNSTSTGEKVNNTYSFIVVPGTGTKQANITFANKTIAVEYSYAKPKVLKHGVEYNDPLSLVKLYGANFGTNSSLCNIKYNGIEKECQVIDHHQIQFKVEAIEISSNISITIDGIISDSYIMELVKCKLVNEQLYPASFGCLESEPVVNYFCDGLSAYSSKTDPHQLLNATFDDEDTIIDFQGNNISVHIKEGASSSTLKLFLNGFFSKSNQINRKEGIVYDSKIQYDEQQSLINLHLTGFNFGEPYDIILPTVFNTTIVTKNCSMLFHGTKYNKNCTIDIITCQLALPHSFNKDLILEDEESSNSTLTIPFTLKLGNNTIYSSFNNIEHIPAKDNNKKTRTIALATTLSIGTTLLFAGGVYGVWKYHQNKIENTKKEKN